MLIAIFITICYGSSLIDVSNNNNITDLFNECGITGENQEYLLFQCKHMNALIQKTSLTEENITVYSYNRTLKAYLSNWILSELDLELESQKYILRFSQIVFSGEGVLLQQMHSQNIEVYETYEFRSTQIDGILTVFGLLTNHKLSKYTGLSIIHVYPNYSSPSMLYNLTCDDICKLIDYGQFYNKNRNSLVMIILESNQMNIFEYSFIAQQFRQVSTYSIHQLMDKNETPQNMIVQEGYIILKYESFQALFSISSLLYEIQMITSFSLDPLYLNAKNNYIFQQSLNETHLFIIEQSNNWQIKQQVRLIEKLPLQFSKSIYVVNQSFVIFIYDNFTSQKLILDAPTIQTESNCAYNSSNWPVIDYKSIYYQLNLLQQTEFQISESHEEQLKQLQNQTSCTKPCNILFSEFNTSFLVVDQQCIMKDLAQLIVNPCSKFGECYSCMNQTGCQWKDYQCSSETDPYTINPSSNEFSSQWQIGKVLQCEKMLVEQQSQMCGYDQKYFNIVKSFTYSGKIRKGQVCTWFFDAHKLQQFQLFISTDFLKLTNKVQQSICLGHNQSLCEHYKIDTWNQNGTIGFQFKGFYFRYSIIFFEENLANNFTIAFTHTNSMTITEKLKQSVIQMIAWLLCGIIIFAIMGYIAKRRLQFLVAQTLEIEIHNIPQQLQIQTNLNNESLRVVIQNLLDQEIITKYPSDPSLFLYGEDHCSFCFEKYDVSQIVAQIFCGHIFHYPCLEDWIRVKGQLEKCPICNQKADHFLANKQEYSIIKSQILDRLNDGETQNNRLID